MAAEKIRAKPQNDENGRKNILVTWAEVAVPFVVAVIAVYGSAEGPSAQSRGKKWNRA